VQASHSPLPACYCSYDFGGAGPRERTRKRNARSCDVLGKWRCPRERCTVATYRTRVSCTHALHSVARKTSPHAPTRPRTFTLRVSRHDTKVATAVRVIAGIGVLRTRSPPSPFLSTIAGKCPAVYSQPHNLLLLHVEPPKTRDTRAMSVVLSPIISRRDIITPGSRL